LRSGSAARDDRYRSCVGIWAFERSRLQLVLGSHRRPERADAGDRRRAGVGPATLYRRFPAKDLLVTEVFTASAS
jgi:hypothetical protein